MKQTVEEAAKEYIYKARASFVGITPEEYEEQINPEYPYNTGTDKDFESLFIAGADWQAKQSSWISVEERPPKHNIEVIICHEREFYIGKMYHSMQSNWWRVSEDERTDMIVNEDDFWMPIPSFDEILEANKDVLERMKEKGD